MSMRVAIRADASLQIGTGHIMRCKTLADELRGRGAEVRFICREHPGNLIPLLRDAGYSTAVLPASATAGTVRDLPADDYAAWLGVEQSDDAVQTLLALGDFTPDWLVVDHYGLDVTWERFFRTRVRRIFVIDDLANRLHDCDLLLDQNLYVNMESRYTGLLPRHCRQLLGPRFALLRPEFRKARESARKRNGMVRRILVFFGGVDPTGETAKVLEAVQRSDHLDVVLDVVVGASNPLANDIRGQCDRIPNVAFHCQVANMAALMAASDFSFGAGGSTHWERCSVGLPTAVTVTAANQLDTTRELARRQIVLALGSSAEVGVTQYQLALNDLTKGWPAPLQDASFALVDGRGSDRVILNLCDVGVQLRRATTVDAEKAWKWRNHPITRKNSSNSSMVPLHDHLAWWHCSLSDPSRILLIGVRWGVEIGVLRYDLTGVNRAIVSIYLDPDLHGLGQGVAMLRAGQIWMIEHFPHVHDIEAKILPDNVASQRAFSSVGFRLRNDTWIWNNNFGQKPIVGPTV